MMETQRHERGTASGPCCGRTHFVISERFAGVVTFFLPFPRLSKPHFGGGHFTRALTRSLVINGHWRVSMVMKCVHQCQTSQTMLDINIQQKNWRGVWILRISTGTASTAWLGRKLQCGLEEFGLCALELHNRKPDTIVLAESIVAYFDDC